MHQVCHKITRLPKTEKREVVGSFLWGALIFSQCRTRLFFRGRKKWPALPPGSWAMPEEQLVPQGCGPWTLHCWGTFPCPSGAAPLNHSCLLESWSSTTPKISPPIFHQFLFSSGWTPLAPVAPPALAVFKPARAPISVCLGRERRSLTSLQKEWDVQTQHCI